MVRNLRSISIGVRWLLNSVLVLRLYIYFDNGVRRVGEDHMSLGNPFNAIGGASISIAGVRQSPSESSR